MTSYIRDLLKILSEEIEKESVSQRHTSYQLHEFAVECEALQLWLGSLRDIRAQEEVDRGCI